MTSREYAEDLYDKIESMIFTNTGCLVDDNTVLNICLFHIDKIMETTIDYNIYDNSIDAYFNRVRMDLVEIHNS